MDDPKDNFTCPDILSGNETANDAVVDNRENIDNNKTSTVGNGWQK